MPQLKISKPFEIPNKNIIIQKYYIYGGIKYMVDNKTVIIDYSQKELEVAEWLINKFGGKVKILLKINWPENIKTPDYIFQGEKWDLKQLKNATSKTRAVDNVIKECKNQASNFIIDISNCKISDILLIKQLEKTFGYGNYKRSWIKKIILKRDNNLLKVFKRK